MQSLQMDEEVSRDDIPNQWTKSLQIDERLAQGKRSRWGYQNMIKEKKNAKKCI